MRIPNLKVGTSLHEYIVDRDDIGPVRYMFTYTVIGKGDFPFDMLRIDGAYPADTMSALALQLGSDVGDRQVTREVRLFAHGGERWLPTFDRWRSFGWVVKSTAWE